MIVIYIFIIVFILLTILHPIGDFIAPRRWHGEYWIVLNPLHIVWDNSVFRVHSKYSCTESKFWKWLGIDQLSHVILNLILAGLLEWIL